MREAWLGLIVAVIVIPMGCASTAVCRSAAPPSTVDESTSNVWRNTGAEPHRRPCAEARFDVVEGEQVFVEGRRFVHDPGGRLIEVRTRTAQGEATALRNTHDANGLLVRQDTDGDGDGRYEWRTLYDYDGAGRLLGTRYENDAGIVQSSRRSRYDGGGRLVRVESLDEGGTVRSFIDYAYDRRGNPSAQRWYVAGEASPHTKVRMRHDRCHRLVDLRAWDDAGRLKERTLSRFDRTGNLVRSGSPGKFENRYRYDASERLIAREHRVPGLPPTQTRFTYDASGRRTAQIGDRDSTEYRYDGTGNLVAAHRQRDDGTESSVRWQYDCDPLDPSY